MSSIISGAHRRLRYAPPPVRVAPARGGEAGATVTWTPFPGPQRMALESAADIIGYGGAAGGGKTDLLLGMAYLQHRRALIFRREFTRLDALIDRSRAIYGPGLTASKDSYNENLHRWKFADGRMIRFAAMQKVEDWRKYQGQAADFHGFDEATEFVEAQVRSVIAWNRSAVPGQRCRVLLTFNPPTDANGEWVLRFFGPWLDPDYTGERARPGELRWFTTRDGKDVEVEPGTPGAKSRTFIPASLADNPVLVAAGYGDTIEALPEPLRSILRGDWTAGRQADPWGVIPPAWVQAATRRAPPDDPGPLSALGVDVARGGPDETTIAALRGRVVEDLAVFPGAATPDGQSVAALVLQRHADGCPVGVDVIGVGSSPYDHLAGMVPTVAINAGEGTEFRDRSGQIAFINVRAAMWWAFREALDPKSGEGLVLPDDPQLRAELQAPRFSVQGRRIKVESKEEVRKRLGRSTNRADAVIQAYWAAKLHMPIFLFGDADADLD